MVKKHALALGLLLSWLSLSPCPTWADFSAKVMVVHEGDRLTIYHKGRKQEIRLRGVDCPKLKQPYGKQAKHATGSYVGNREVVIRALKRNRQGHLTADVLLTDGRNLSRELLKEGLAWSRPETSEQNELKDIEQLAKAAGKGLWADKNPVPPWKWKQSNKIKRRKFSN